MAIDKTITLTRRAARVRKYSVPEFNIRKLEEELTHHRNNSDATRFGTVNLAGNKKERMNYSDRTC